MSKKKKFIKQKSVAPIYCVAFFWLFWGSRLPLYRPIHFIACAILSLLIFMIGKAIWPNKIINLEEEAQKDNRTNDSVSTSNENNVQKNVEPEPVKVSTGDEELDKMIDDKDKAISEMHRLNAAIKDPVVSDQIDHLEIVTTKIVKAVMEHPDKKKQVRRFFNYYLPTTLKLLNAYDRMDEAGVSGMNIDGTMDKVESMMDTAIAAFDKQLDALFADEALDISTDISVMENMLKSEGLVDDPLAEDVSKVAEMFESQYSVDDLFASVGQNQEETLKQN